jgi:antitoxin MazE
MTRAVKTHIVKIGNSQGIRIPKLLLEQANFAENEEIELEVQENQIVIRRSGEPRHGWDAAFKVMTEQGDDVLLDGEVRSTTDWDEEEWEWQ